MTCSRFLAGYCLLLAACHRPVAEAPPTSRAIDSAIQAYDADSIDPDVGVEVSCMFEKKAAHPDGSALITEFLARDSRGDFLKTDDWFNGATDCSGHEPGPDSYLLIA